MLGIIIVNFKTIDETVNYIQGELCKISTPHKIVVVNVASDEHTNNTLTAKLGASFVPDVNAEIDKSAQVFVLPSQENLGYARGNNLGAEFFRKNFAPELLLITNNDLVLHYDVVKPLIDTLLKREDIGAIGPRVLGVDGKDQSPHRFPSFNRFVFSKLFYPFYAILARFKIMSHETITNAPEGYYYRLVGCFFIIPSKIFQAIGGFDPGTFLYGEELILSERLASIGFRCYFQPAAVITHNHGQITSKSLSKNKIASLMFESELYYFQHYRGITGVKYFIGRFSIWLYQFIYSPVINIIKFGKWLLL